MRYQKTNERRAVILMVVLSMLALFALVGVTFVLYADAEAAAARVAREAQTQRTSDVNPKEALAFFLGQLIYDVPDTAAGAASGIRGHSLARTMYGFNYTVPVPTPGLNLVPFNGVGRPHYGCPSVTYPVTALNGVPANWATQLDDYAMVNYTWFATDGFVRDPERVGVRTNAQLQGFSQTNPYVGANAPYTYPDLNNFFLAAVRADGTVLTPSYHRPWLFQWVNGVAYAFNDMTNPNWTNTQGKYLTLRPRPLEHPQFPLPGDATGDVKNLTWAPGGNDSIWIDLGAPIMTAPDGTQYKMMFAPLVMDLDGRVNLNTAGNLLASVSAMTAVASSPPATPPPTLWQTAAGSHVSNQGWGPWEVNLAKVLYGDQTLYPQTTPPTPPEWMRLFTGMSYAMTTAPNPPTLPFIVQAGAIPPAAMPPGILSWMLPGIPGRYLESVPGGLWTPNFAGLSAPFAYPPAPAFAPLEPFYAASLGLNTTYQHAYAMSDFNGLNEVANPLASSRPLMPGSVANVATNNPAANLAINPYASFQQGFGNGNAVEATNHPLLYNGFQTPLSNTYLTRAFTAADMSALLRPNVSISGPVDANASAATSDLLRMCPFNFPSDAALATLPAAIKSLALRYRNLVTTQSYDIGSPGVTPYWWNGMDATSYLASPFTNITGAPTPNYLLAPFAAQPQQTVAGVPSYGFPPLPPNPGNGNVPATNPILSEFANTLVAGALVPDWRSVSANSSEYFPTTNPAGYVTPGARIRLNRPLPPYPHMGSFLMPPYNPPSMPPNATLTPYGTAYPFNATTAPNMANAAIAGQFNQYTAAQQARQALATDIYRRLLAITGVLPIPPSPAGVTPPPSGTSGNPNNTQLAPRRWLAQLAVNIVDYIDEDDIMTPFNFYIPQDNNNVALANPPAVAGNPLNTQGPDDPTPTGANPDYWVFGTELPKVVINEVLAESKTVATSGSGNDTVKVWVELFNTMPNPAAVNPTVLNTQPQDAYRVPLYVTNPAGAGYSPYRVSIAQYTMDRVSPTVSPKLQLPNPPPNPNPPLPDSSANVLGKACITGPFPQSTTDADFSGVIPLSQMLAATPPNPAQNQQPFLVPGTANTINAGVDAANFFLIGPKPDTTNYPSDPFVYSTPPQTPPVSLPQSIPVLQTNSMTYNQTWTANSTSDERSTGITVMLRRLANPYLPPQLDPNLAYYNPYVTVDYIRSVPLEPASNATNLTYGKRQPFAGLLQGTFAPPFFSPLPTSPVYAQTTTATPTPPPNTIATMGTAPSQVSNTFGLTNYPLPQSGHYDWLVHLDRPPISPMELLHVSAWPPYKLTQHFIRGDDTQAALTTATAPPLTYINTFGHYAPWFDGLPLGVGLTAPATPPNPPQIACPWWFDVSLAAGQSHRLYRLFEFLECGDRAFGVNGLGRIPGKININTIWDSEILQALIDANQSMGIPPNPSNTPLSLGTDPVSQVFANMMASRSPSYYNAGTYTNALTPPNPSPFPIGPTNMGTGLDDRPFMPLSTGMYMPKGTPTGGLQFPNGFSVSTDTILRTNNPFAKELPSYPAAAGGAATNNVYLLFQNYYDTPGGSTLMTSNTTSAVHPYMQTQMLTKMYNNVTTRSNVFGVFLTVGFFQVMDPTTTPPTLGPEMGSSEGKQIRHRMFSIVDRTNLATFTTTGQALAPGVTGPTPNPLYPTAAVNFTGLQTGAQSVALPVLPPPFTIIANPANPAQLLVPNLTSGMPGVIQPGTQLVIDAGTVNEETVTVISFTPPVGAGPATIQANFNMPHGVGGIPFSITQRGNPGPWLLIPYDPRLDPSVVPYFSVIE